MRDIFFFLNFCVFSNFFRSIGRLFPENNKIAVDVISYHTIYHNSFDVPSTAMLLDGPGSHPGVDEIFRTRADRP